MASREEIRGLEFSSDTRPTSTLVEVSALAIPGAKIEVEAVAVVRA
jgi:enamine deaminase RidA (YjgF/YER057c/UK114 family)